MKWILNSISAGFEMVVFGSRFATSTSQLCDSFVRRGIDYSAREGEYPDNIAYPWQDARILGRTQSGRKTEKQRNT